ncbi:MAG: DNA polymerase III subunit gamma/tau [Gemmatimonadaceae bacterium]|nr:DNA polymerase III subunit gamma/tau [Gemmatimonadaceae bacterium]
MIALARKYRPKSFDTVAVQSHVAATLKGAIARGRVAHGYLLCGPRGVGKTTLARVLAMALNCENKRADGEPCGTCQSCERIWTGSASLDVVEIDAASNRGVDDARELRERAMYAPSGDDRYKVYIVDEAHMLTREAWNALLKILEEPPPRVVFVFATTEPQKITQLAAPVLSRLQRFDFRRMSAGDVRDRLRLVLADEGITASEDALSIIARAADGSMRDGLSLTDQVLALGDGEVTSARVREALGLVPEDEYIGLLDLIAERRAGDVFDVVSRLVEMGIDLGQFLTGLSDMLRAQLAVSLGSRTVEVSEEALKALEDRKSRYPSGDLLRMLTAVAELEPKFRKSGQQQILLEALLVRFALLDRTVDLEAVLREMGPGGGGGGGGATASRNPAPSPRPSAPPDRPSAPPERPTTPPARLSSAPERPTAGAERLSSAPERPTAGAERLSSAPERPTAGAERLSSAPERPTAASERLSIPPGRPSTPPERPVRAEGPGSRDAAAPMPRVTEPVPRALSDSQPGATDARGSAGGRMAVAEPVPRRVAPVQSQATQPASHPSGRAAAPLDINAIVEAWDDIVAGLRRDRPLVASLLEHAVPVAVTAGGLLTLQLDQPGLHEGAASRIADLTGALVPGIAGITRVAIKPPASDARPSPKRMTAESVKADTLQSLRKKSPMLADAIDALDLELL